MLLPMIQVLDGESGEIVKCAVIRDRGDCWICKPLNAANFDPREFIGNRAFHMAWWRIAKDDLSAESIDDEFDMRPVHRIARESVEAYLSETGAHSG